MHEAVAKRRWPRVVLVVLSLSVVLVIALWAVFTAFVGQPYRVGSDSMSPTVRSGDTIVVNKLAYRTADPRPGDVIVARVPAAWIAHQVPLRPDNPFLRWVEKADKIVTRVIAVGGQTVTCRADTGLVVDAVRIDEPYLDSTTMDVDPKIYPCLGSEYGPLTVPAGRLWVMGDNRTHSADSRVYCGSVQAHIARGVLCTGDPAAGTIPVDDVVGMVWSVESGQR